MSSVSRTKKLTQHRDITTSFALGRVQVSLTVEVTFASHSRIKLNFTSYYILYIIIYNMM